MNLEPLALLLSTAIRPLPGPEAEKLHEPSQARHLAAPTPNMQRMEAQRVLQASAYVIGGALRDIDRGDTTRGNQLLQQMSQVLTGQATATEQGSKIQQAALEVSKHPVLKQEAPLVLHAVALAQSVQQLVKLEQPAQKQVQREARAESRVEESKQMLQAPKRRGPKL